MSKPLTPEQAYCQLRAGTSQNTADLESIVAANGWHAYRYACYVIKGPFTLGEPAISKSGRCAYRYAHYVLKSRFPLGESAIAKYGCWSFWYARDVLHDRFELGEPAIEQCSYASSYNEFLKSIAKQEEAK